MNNLIFAYTVAWNVRNLWSLSRFDLPLYFIVCSLNWFKDAQEYHQKELMLTYPPSDLTTTCKISPLKIFSSNFLYLSTPPLSQKPQSKASFQNFYMSIKNILTKPSIDITAQSST